jgi:hypothetical protein
MTEPTSTNTGLRPGQGAAILGVIAGAMAVWVGPLVLGPIGVGFGAYAEIRGERRGRWVIALAVCGLVLGLLVELLPAKYTMS